MKHFATEEFTATGDPQETQETTPETTPAAAPAPAEPVSEPTPAPTPEPAPEQPIALSRKEKLHLWAAMIRNYQRRVDLFHNLEYQDQWWMDHTRLSAYPSTALGIAATNPMFQSMGLSQSSSVGDALRFLEVSRDELHEFSCYCGGELYNDEQAARIERLANR